MRKNPQISLAILAFCLISLNACKTTGRAALYTESSIPPEDVRGRTVAILPNRLPVTLQNSEKWRTKNYETMKRILTRKGYNVIDYNSSNSLFQQSGLPLEDTKSSRDKYAEVAQSLNADLLVFPYYGTTFTSTGFSNSYTSIASLQFYSLNHNDFSARVDLEGVTKVQTWPSLVPIVGIVWQILTLGPCKKGHDKAFVKGFNSGYEAYFSRFSPSDGERRTKSKKTVAPEPSASKYAKYSLEELKMIKKAAVASGDYEKAAAIKAEMESR